MKKASKKLVAIVLVVTMMMSILTLTGCGKNSGPKEGQTVIRMMGWGDTYETSIFQSMIDMFMEKYPEYYVTYDPISSGNFMTVLHNSIANPREMPDVFYCADIEFIRLAYSTNIFEDLNPYIEASDEP